MIYFHIGNLVQRQRQDNWELYEERLSCTVLIEAQGKVPWAYLLTAAMERMMNKVNIENIENL